MDRVDDTLGAMLIGAFVAVLLYGILTLQTHLYYTEYPKDSPWLKSLVATIWTSDTVYIALICHAMYTYLVTQFANSGDLRKPLWSLTMSWCLNLVIIVSVQCIFAWLIFQVVRPTMRWWLAGPIAALVMAHLASGIVVAVEVFERREFTEIIDMPVSIVLPFAILNLAPAVAIATTLCIVLREFELPRRRSVLRTLVVYAVHRCVLPVALIAAQIAIFKIRPRALWHLALDFSVGRVFANSLLATLNARTSPRTGLRQNTFALNIRSSKGADAKTRAKAGESVGDDDSMASSGKNDKAWLSVTLEPVVGRTPSGIGYRL